MKTIIKNIALCGCIAFGMGMTSCEDLMTVDTGDKAYVNANDTLYSYLGVMRAMQDVAERQVILGEIRGDLVTSSEYATDTLHAISNFEDPKDQSCSMLQVSDYYNVINNCNFYIYNCDTSTVRANVKYMIPEYTQVKAIRAWAYLQLVKNYKEVPYITEPIKNLDVIKNFDYANNLVNKDNLIDKLLEDGLANMVDINYPQYGKTGVTWGNWSNGALDVSARNCFIPIRLVLGDAYLLRGANQSDYENAAYYYYSFLRKEDKPIIMQYCSVNEDADFTSGYSHTTVSEVTNFFGSFATEYTYSENNEVITFIPSSANAGLGKMLTRVAEIYGYGPSSSQSTDATEVEDEDGNTSTEYSAGGAINVSPTYKRQYYPSFAYEDVNLSQKFVSYSTLTSDKEKTVKYYDQMDGREYYSYNSVLYEKKEYKLCGKMSSTSSFYYTIPIYRKTLVWLRLAEALNRAGYPEFAFAILKDGINQNTLPSVKDITKNLTIEIEGETYNVWTKENDTIYHLPDSKPVVLLAKEGGDYVPYTGNTAGFQPNTYKVRELTYNSIESMYYVTDSTKLQKFLSKFSFTDDIWNKTYGIHARGGGFGYKIGKSSVPNMWEVGSEYVSTNISGRRDTIFFDYKAAIERKLDGKKFENATEDDIINAVEDVIVDELALETAFEGNRFYDLVRVAEHKNQSGYKGTEWLAKKIANRNSKQATKNSPAVDGFDAGLYSKLQNQKLWYFTLPAWK